MRARKIQLSGFGGPEVLQVAEFEVPALGPRDVLVRSHAIGVGWPDVYVRTGTYPWQHLFPMPATPGIEMAGRVAAAGAEVADLPVGRPVYVSSRLMGFRGGCYAEAMVVPRDVLVELPGNVDLDVAAGLAYYQLAVALLRAAGAARPAGWAMVSGASGGVGTALVQTAKAFGYRVLASVGHDDKRAHATAVGADAVINYRTDAAAAAIAGITGGHGVDLWLESFVGPDFGQVFRSMAPWGKVMLYNAVGGHPAPAFFDDWRAAMGKCVSVQYFSMHVYEDDPQAMRDLLSAAMRLIVDGAIKPPAGTFFKLEDAAQAHRLLESGTNRGRIFLRP